MREEIRRLVEQARADLRSAEKAILYESYDVSAFYSRQATKKYLKVLHMF
jgi:HEPN domain-containing protein